MRSQVFTPRSTGIINEKRFRNSQYYKLQIYNEVEWWNCCDFELGGRKHSVDLAAEGEGMVYALLGLIKASFRSDRISTTTAVILRHWI